MTPSPFLIQSIADFAADGPEIVHLLQLIQEAYRHPPEGSQSWTHEARFGMAPRTSLATLQEWREQVSQYGSLKALVVGMKEGAVSSRYGGMVATARLVIQQSATHESERWCSVEQIAIDPYAQGQGLGKAWLRAVEAYGESWVRRLELAAWRGFRLEVLAPRTELVRFYERRGYALTGASRPLPITAAVAGLRLLQMQKEGTL